MGSQIHPQFPKVCGCCKAAIGEHLWSALLYRGVQEDEVQPLEMRNCRCGSTLAIELVLPVTQRPFESDGL